MGVFEREGVYVCVCVDRQLALRAPQKEPPCTRPMGVWSQSPGVRPPPITPHTRLPPQKHTRACRAPRRADKCCRLHPPQARPNPPIKLPPAPLQPTCVC